MITSQKTTLPASLDTWTNAREAVVARAFSQMAVDFEAMIVLDAIDASSDPPEVRIQAHDAHGPLPGVLVATDNDWDDVLKHLEAETAKLAAINKIRADLASLFPRCLFLPPTKMDDDAVVGLAAPNMTLLVEGPTFCIAYHELKRRATADCRNGGSNRA